MSTRWWIFPITGATLVLCALGYYKFGGWRAARMTRAATLR
jgi:hypothetical protein